MASQPPEPPRLQLDEFQQLRQYVNENSGIALSPDSRLTMERKLGERVQALGLPGFREYCTYLRTHPQRKLEIERAVDLITTNETYFFREMTQLRAFEQEVLVHLHETARARRKLVIWSAGCSTGEEVYTLAILVKRSSLFTGWDVRIIGIDGEGVARHAVYTAELAGPEIDVSGPSPVSRASSFENVFMHTLERSGSRTDSLTTSLCARLPPIATV